MPRKRKLHVDATCDGGQHYDCKGCGCTCHPSSIRSSVDSTLDPPITGMSGGMVQTHNPLLDDDASYL